MYDPHASVNLIEERDIMSRGRLVKARLPDKPAPNVSWYWFMLGNCTTCKFYTELGKPGAEENAPRCANKDIPRDDFLFNYLQHNTCPGFEVDGRESGDGLDVMKAIGLVPGEPSQRVVVLHDSPWTVDLAIRAHREASIFLDKARVADYVARGGKNDPKWGEYVDLEDDLERGEPAATAEPPEEEPEDMDIAAALATNGGAGQWITIGGHPGGDKGEMHVGGFPVFVDGSGKILKGRFAGKKVQHLKKHFDKLKARKAKAGGKLQAKPVAAPKAPAAPSPKAPAAVQPVPVEPDEDILELDESAIEESTPAVPKVPIKHVPLQLHKTKEVKKWRDDNIAKNGAATDDEKLALSEYGSSVYKNMNSIARGQGIADEKLVSRQPTGVSTEDYTKSLINSLDSLMAKRVIKTDVVSARGVNNRQLLDKLNALSVGGEFTDNGFMSTSIMSGVVQTFSKGVDDPSTRDTSAEAVFHINIPAGTHGVVITSGQEGELLLARGTRMRIDHREGNTFHVSVIGQDQKPI